MRTERSGTAGALFPLVRQRVIAALLLRSDEALHLRELARRAELAPATVQREVASLTTAGVLERVKVGRQVYYRANQRCPVYPELRALALKTFGVADVLHEALAPLGPKVRLAFVFGSVADGTADADSDLDLMVIGDATLADLAPLLRRVRETLTREINVVTLTYEDALAALRTGDHFLEGVLTRPIIAVTGDTDELTRLVGAGKPAP